jgi:hypothetical protein
VDILGALLAGELFGLRGLQANAIQRGEFQRFVIVGRIGRAAHGEVRKVGAVDVISMAQITLRMKSFAEAGDV